MWSMISTVGNFYVSGFGSQEAFSSSVLVLNVQLLPSVRKHSDTKGKRAPESNADAAGE